MEPIFDKRVNAKDYMIEMTIIDYYDLVKDCLNDNEYQRKRVKNSGSIYSLLKKDLTIGCIMPPIVLAYCDQLSDGDLFKSLQNNRSKIKILDGLQRSYTIKELIDEIGSDAGKAEALNNKIRVEIYVGLNKLGLLYRMLTLNTGQTPMSIRHQIEIIYSDYKKSCKVAGVKLLSEIDSETPYRLGEYKFRDIIDGFTSYLQKDYLTLDRMDILDNVKNLERVATVDSSIDLFDDYLSSYYHFAAQVNERYPDKYADEQDDLLAAPYASNSIQLFNKSQSMTGYGNAIATLCDLGVLNSFKDVSGLIDKMIFSNIDDDIYSMIKHLDNVRKYAKKIGNDQRMYFYFFFKFLFDKESEAYLNFSLAENKAYHSYERQVL